MTLALLLFVGWSHLAVRASFFGPLLEVKDVADVEHQLMVLLLRYLLVVAN